MYVYTIMPSRKQQKKNNKTRRIRGGDDEQNKCKNTMCQQKKFEEFHKKTLVIFETILKEIETKLKKEGITTEEKKNLEEELKIQKKLIKKMNNVKNIEKNIKILKDGCEKKFCNKGCLGTIFEEGDPNKLPAEFAKKFKGNKQLLDLLTEQRKTIFGKKTNVLKDDFYEGLKKNNVNKTKKKGAISGCVKILMNND